VPFPSCKFSFHLDDDSDVEIVLHDGDEPIDKYPSEQHLYFSYRYFRDKPDAQRGGEPELLNEQQLRVLYKDGKLAPTLKLTMHVIIPERLGKRYAYGADLSPGAKTFIEFEYERTDPDTFRLTQIQIGRKVLDLKELAKDQVPVKPLEFPFPVNDVITRPYQDGDRKYGPLQVPWMHNSGETRHWGIDDHLLLRPQGL